ncbi:MAG TPA: hypothetical protein VFQ15_05095 [Jiangellaceae bacterium]|nr:hypothetical protein [Jiangellaceae bacterium]
MNDNLPVLVVRTHPTPTQPAVLRGAWLVVAAAGRTAAAVRQSYDGRPDTTGAADLAAGALAVTTAAAGAVVARVVGVAGEITRSTTRRLGPVERIVDDRIARPIRELLGELARRGQAQRRRSEADLDHVLDALVPQVTAAVLDRLDLTDVVLRRVDMDAIAARIDVAAIAERIDIEKIIDQIDLAAVTEDVMDAVDLPELIRQSTGSLASDSVLEVRLQGIEADDAVNRFVDRLLRRGRRKTEAPQDSAPDPGLEVDSP